jgi:23S rRNA (cytosine1962-C5)-methyltransferase
VLSRRKKETVDDFDLARRIQEAVAARAGWLGEDSDAVRLVHGEGDGLPGLIVDRYADVLSVQFLTQGMEAVREPVLAALKEATGCSVIVERGDNRGRALEGLPTEKKVLEGDLPDLVRVRQDGLAFDVDVLGGQKTGFFLDQRKLRRSLKNWVEGKSVLDVFCYTGAASVYARAAGAASVTGVDSSLPALEAAERNMAANDFPETEWIQGDAFGVLQSLEKEERQFDVVLLDPPPFAPSKKDVSEAKIAHTRLHKLALRVLKPGGILISSSCSYHIGSDLLGASAAHAAVQAGRTLSLLEEIGAGPDHPGVPGMPESRYLNTLVMQARG